MPVVMLVSIAPVQVALLLFSIAFFCPQAWSGLIMTLPADVFPLTFGRKGVALTAISAVDIALWDLMGKDAKQPVFRLLGGRTKENIPVYASRLYAMPIPELRIEAQKYKDEGYKMMKLRFGWGPLDGAAGMQKDIEFVRNVREVIGYQIDLMTDAYMGWTLDYAKRMLPLLEPFQLRRLEEAVIPDDTRGYKELKSYRRIPIAGGEHEFTIFGFRELLENNALDVIQFDTNRVGGISQARKISAHKEPYRCASYSLSTETIAPSPSSTSLISSSSMKSPLSFNWRSVH